MVAAESLAPNDEARELLRVIEAPNDVAFPWAVAPGVPRERVEALRKAVADSFADPEFQAAAKQATLDANPSSGEQVNQKLQGLVSTSPAILARVKEILEVSR